MDGEGGSGEPPEPPLDPPLYTVFKVKIIFRQKMQSFFFIILFWQP